MSSPRSVPPTALLEIRDLHLRFGGVAALSEIDLDVREREILAIIGPNGAGKTSLLNCVSGLYRPQKGRLRLVGENGAVQELRNKSSHRIARLGIARTFQNIELFHQLTVLDNLMLGRHIHMRGNVLGCALYWGRQRREEIAHRRKVEEIIDFLEIEELRHHRVASLAYGLQKRVELGRALALEPRILLLDEPMAGMNVEEKEDMARFVLDVHEERAVTVVLIEHDMGVVMDLADRVAVLDFGRKIADGTPAEVRADPRVVQAYLGEADQRSV